MSSTLSSSSSPIICGNWKMNLGPQSTRTLVSELIPVANELTNTRCWIAPPFVSISTAVTAATNSKLKVGAQNVHWAESGAFTGEISSPMLKEVGAEFVIVGHSERRHIFLESDESVANRLNAALKGSLFAILCVGETEKERNSGETTAILERQIRSAFTGKSEREIASIIVAYEPVWAIGTGKVANSTQISEAHLFIRNLLKEFSKLVLPPILYGGSVTPENFKEISAIPEVGGALVGGASLVSEKFTKLLQIVNNP